MPGDIGVARQARVTPDLRLIAQQLGQFVFQPLVEVVHPALALVVFELIIQVAIADKDIVLETHLVPPPKFCWVASLSRKSETARVRAGDQLNQTGAEFSIGACPNR